MRIVLLASLVALVPGCGADRAPTVKPLLSELQTQVFNLSCVFSSCHAEAAHKGDLVLTAGRARAALLNVLAANPEARRLDKKRVVPGEPDSSYLFQKVNRAGARFCTLAQLEHGDPTCEGEQMPGSNDRLSQERIDALRQWILGGALDN